MTLATGWCIPVTALNYQAPHRSLDPSERRSASTPLCSLRFEMTYTVSSGTLNPTIPYHTIPSVTSPVWAIASHPTWRSSVNFRMSSRDCETSTRPTLQQVAQLSPSGQWNSAGWSMETCCSTQPWDWNDVMALAGYATVMMTMMMTMMTEAICCEF